jgi:ActR/RegA family two-component response regulator
VWSHVIRPTARSRGTPHQSVTDVLIVDGDESSLELLQRALRGYRVVTALDGGDALMRARRCRPAVVVADERLVGLSGSDVINALRHEYADVQAVLLTCAADGVTEDVAFDPHVHVLTKRAAVHDLRRLITALIGSPRGRRRER